MRGIRLRFILWIGSWIGLFFLANLRLRVFPHILLLFWTLLPVLSMIFSLISRPKLEMKLTAVPMELPHGEKGIWRCVLTNNSRWMAFFLRFPDLVVLEGKRPEAFELMLRPGETRSMQFVCELPYAGCYPLRAKEPIFEDLLGFFWLSFAKRFTESVGECLALPMVSASAFTMEQRSLLSRFRVPIERRSFDTMTDEVFSIDPISPGESLSRTHWKLSARLQEWMIRHYCERSIEPVAVAIHLSPVPAAPSILLDNTKNRDMTKRQKRLLENRDRLLDAAYSVVAEVLQSGGSAECYFSTNDVMVLRTPDDLLPFGRELSRIPFEGNETAEFSDIHPERRLLLFYDGTDERVLGEMIERKSLGQSFLLISFLANTPREIRDSLHFEGIDCLWLDEEVGDE